MLAGSWLDVLNYNRYVQVRTALRVEPMLKQLSATKSCRQGKTDSHSLVDRGELLHGKRPHSLHENTRDTIEPFK